MTALILAGGRGTRLQPFTISIPKPLLPIGDVPILEVVLAQLAKAGVRRVIVALGHMPHLFAACIGTGERFGVSVEYCREDTPLGTAGALRLVQDPPEHLLVMNGDLLTTLDYAALYDAHQRAGAAATIAVHRRTMHVDYGVIEVHGDGTLDRYIEKPSIPYLVSMGVNVVSRAALERVPQGERFDIPDLMRALKATGDKVLCVESDCYWQDIGRFDDYQRASADYAADPARFLDVPYGQP